MPRPRPIEADAPGQDSFLDVVANLVGIIIILIMVVGAATKKAIDDHQPLAALSAPSNDSSSNAPPAVDEAAELAEKARQAERALEEAARDTAAIATVTNETIANLEKQTFEIAYRRAERDKMLLLMTAAERELAERRGKLDDSQQAEFDLAKQVSAAHQELDDLTRKRKALEKDLPPPGVIEHLPTPMAKTVFGKELHFRLLHGKLVHVPWEELVDRLKADAPQKVWKLKDTPRVTETLGPIQGFWMKYTLKRTEVAIRTGAGAAVQQRAELDKFVIIPELDDLGEPVSEALQPNSDFHAVLKGHDPSRTTVTVWVYPDSFGQFRHLKQDMFTRGFLSAARPMPEGHPLGGSPDGTRSSAQ